MLNWHGALSMKIYKIQYLNRDTMTNMSAQLLTDNSGEVSKFQDLQHAYDQAKKYYDIWAISQSGR